ncbi:MAG: hypothetical protein ABI348_11190 [Nitrososphaera sp.]
MGAGYIAIGIAAVVAIFVLLLAASNYANASLQYRSRGAQGYDFSKSSTDVAMDVCNPTPFSASFDRLQFVAAYKDSDLATIKFENGSVPANAATTVDGALQINGKAALAAVFQSFADSLNGKSTGDASMKVKMTSESRLLGLMPMSQSKEMSGDEFSRMMSGKAGFACPTKG